MKPIMPSWLPAEFDFLDHETPIEDLEALRRLASELGQMGFDSAVEIGSWAGLSALAITAGFLTVFCIDHWEGNPADRLGELARYYGPKKAFQTFCRNMGNRLYRSVFPCVGRSRTYAEVWPSQMGLVFIDADHRYEAVAEDIRLWAPHVARGGILCGHDYGCFEGVTQAVSELTNAGLAVEKAGRSLWVVKRLNDAWPWQPRPEEKGQVPQDELAGSKHQ